MIQFASKETEHLVRGMWKTCFEDTDEFIDLVFTDKYRHENTLIYFENGVAAASLQMYPYSITFYGQEIPFYYFAGLCTLPEYRKRGYMEQLIKKAFSVMQDRKIPLSILIPAEDWLYGFYAKYGYEKVFDKGVNLVPIREIIDLYPDNMSEAYLEFESLFRNRDFCVQKSFTDFETIVEEYSSDGYPPKYNLAGMARIVDAKYLLDIFVEKNPDKSLSVEINDSLIKGNNLSYNINGGEKTMNVHVELLTRLLFGYHLKELPAEYADFFEEHNPIMNLMLE